MSSANLGSQAMLELIAGQHPNGELIVERLLVSPQSEPNHYLLLKSPMFVRGIASGDVIEQISNPKGAFNLKQHGGNLCIRIFSPQSVAAIEQSLTIDIEKLGGDLDLREQRALVYTIHVSCGFQIIEELLNRHVSPPAAWFYGNVYDPESGAPLDWWQAILQPE